MDQKLMEALMARYSLKGQSLVIWGGSGNIGTAIARVAAEHGCDVIGTSRKAENLADTETALADLPGKWLGGVVCEITEDQSVCRAIAEVKRILGARPLDISFANAGAVGVTVGPNDHAMDLSYDDQVAGEKLNHLGPANALRKSIPLMANAKSPKMGATLSMAPVDPLSRVFCYAPGKAAMKTELRMLTAELGVKNGPQWVVFGVDVGFALTLQNATVLDDARKRAILNRLLTRPVGVPIPTTPEEMAPFFQTPDEIADATVAMMTNPFRGATGAMVEVARGYTCTGLGTDAQ